MTQKTQRKQMTKEDALRRILQRNTTKERRLSQIPLPVELKVPKARLNRVQEETIKMMFVEQKWCHNYITGLYHTYPTFDIFKYDYKDLQNITHLDKDKNVVEVEITHLTQQMKQGLVSKYRSNVKSLAAKKKKGEKVGTIGFITEGKSIYLKQYGKGKSYEVVGDNKIKLAGISKPIPVNGLKKQLEWVKSIDEDFEFSSATFDRDKVGDYFFHLTVWVSKEK
jgi:putative transposase